MQPGPLEAGEKVLFIDGRDRRYLVTLKSGHRWHSHHGIVEHDDLIGSPEGRSIRTTGGVKLLVFRPTLADYVLKMKRGAQVVYPKDIGLILVNADVFPGARVLEAGTGSGSLTLALARAVGETGIVVSYEARDDHHEQAVANIATWYQALEGKPQNVDLRMGDVFQGVTDMMFDRMVFDLPEPWHALEKTTRSLAPGGIICSYLPTIPQVQQIVEALRASGFGLITTLEGLVRTWNVEGQSVRPDHRMVGHTGFLVTARSMSPNATS